MGYRLKILTRTWSVYFMTKKQYHKKYGPGTLAMTETDDREIYFRRDKFASETIRHELFHAYLQEYSTHTLDLTCDQMEELCCDVASKHAEDLISKSKELIHALKILKVRSRRIV